MKKLFAILLALAIPVAVYAERMGNLNLDNAPWDDLKVAASSVKLPASQTPTWTAMGNGYLLCFADQATEGNEERVSFLTQMPHKYAEGTDIKPHVHFQLEDDTDCNVRWELTCDWTNVKGTVDDVGAVTADCESGGATTDHEVCGLGTYTGTGKGLSSMFNCTLRRKSSHANDTCNSKDACLMEADFHYQIDTLGSRQEYRK